MSDRQDNSRRGEHEDLLIDLALGQCDPGEQARIERRLAADEALRAVRLDVSRALAAMRLAGDVQPPESLVAETLSRIRTARRTERMLDRQELRRAAGRPTFSLREVLAVAVAVLLVGFVLIPSVQRARHAGRRAKCISNAGQIGTGIRSHSHANDGYLPGQPLEHRRWLPAPGKPAVSNSAALFALIKDDYAPKQVFKCPAISGAPDAFEVRADMVDFPGEAYISYSYQYSFGKYRVNVHRLRAAGQMAILADTNPVFVGGRFRREHLHSSSGNHDGKGQSVLCLAGQVVWQEQPSMAGNDIYLAEGVNDYQGDETPSQPTDSFLLPAWNDTSAGQSR